MARPADRGAQAAHAAEQHRQLGRGQVEHVGPVDHQCLGRDLLAAAQVAAEGVGAGLEEAERVGVGLLGARVGAPGTERHRDLDAALAGRLLDRGDAAEDDQVGQRDPLAARLRVVELLLDALEGPEGGGQLRGLVDLPVLLRGQAHPGAVGAAAQVGLAERRRGGPGGRDEPLRAQAGAEQRRLEARRHRRRPRARGRRPAPGPATAGPRGPRARAAARPDPCRGAAACTRRARRRRRTRRGPRGSGARSSRTPGPCAATRSVVSMVGLRFGASHRSGPG